MPTGKRFLVLLLAAPPCLAGCAVGPDYTPRHAAALGLPARYDAAPTAGARTDLAQWWAVFGDPVLSRLIGQALAGNDDLAAARANLRAARAAVGAARGALLPTLTANPGVGYNGVVRGQGLPGAMYNAGLDAAWEADVFGGNRRALEAARDSADTSQAQLYDTQRTIVAEVALDYINAREAQAQLAVAQGNLATQDQTLNLTVWRNMAGLVSALDVQQARTQRAQTAASIPQLEQTLETSIHAISVLLGRAPGAARPDIAAPSEIPTPPDAIEPGLPADLLRQRPDVVAAEATLAAQVARIGVTQAQLYPALTLSGTLTTSASTLGSLGSTLLGSLLAGVTAPVFQGGQLRAAVAQQRAVADAAVATYHKTLLGAAQDVEDALVALDKAKAGEEQYLIAQNSAHNALLLAQSQYKAGLIDFTALLQTQQTLLSTQNSAVSAKAARATAAVQLYKALGGGWTPPVQRS